jgi:predicted transcriptional regulator
MATVTPPPVSFRITRDEQLAIDFAASALGQSRSDLIRDAIFAYIGRQKINQGVGSTLVMDSALVTAKQL